MLLLTARNWPAFTVGYWLAYVVLVCSGFATANEVAVVRSSLRVDIPDAGGSGVAIAPHLIVTNSHVVDHRMRNDVMVTDYAGETYPATVVALDREADVALCWVAKRRGPWVVIAPRRPIVGATLRLFGWGPRRVLAWGTGQVTSTWRRRSVEVLECSVSSVPGDSGGGLFDEQGRLSALNWGGDRETHYSASTPIEYVQKIAESWVTEALPQDRWEEYQCLGGRCAAPTAGSARGVAPPKWPVSPPTDYDSPAVQSPAQAPPRPTAPPAAQAPSVDTDQLVSQLVAKLATDDRFRGPAGPPGKDGRDGKDGKSADIDHDAIVADVLARIDLDAIAARVPQPSAAVTKKVHYVVVGSESVDGWERTAAAVRTASRKFQGITTADPPANYTGQLPVVVKYTNGIPEYVARGSYQVEQALTALSRGQAL